MASKTGSIKQIAQKVKLPSAPKAKLGGGFPRGPKAPQMGTASQNLNPYKMASKMPKGGF
jgi:hypothetical protein